MCIKHKWGPWEKCTAYETFNKVRTGKTFQAVARECSKCLRTQIKDRYL